MFGPFDITFRVLPLYGQTEVGDRDTVDVPEWEAGIESFVFNETMVCVATQMDTEGEVEIRVSSRALARPYIDWVEIFQGDLLIPSGVLAIGNSMAAQVQELELETSGSINIRILGVPSEVPRKIAVILA